MKLRPPPVQKFPLACHCAVLCDYYYRMGMSPGIITELAQWESQTQDFQIAAIHDICILSTSMR